jgi:hypothetical protein
VADDDKDDIDNDDADHVAEAPTRPGFPLQAAANSSGAGASNGTGGQLQFVSAEGDLEDIFRKPSIGELQYFTRVCSAFID